MCAVFLLAAALGFVGIAAVAPTAQTSDKKTVNKGKDDGKAKTKDNGKSKVPDKMPEPAKDTSKAKTPLDQMKLPKDAVIIVVDSLRDAMSLIPQQAVMKFEEWLAMKEQIKALERQLKPEKKVPFSCTLTGRLDGDFLVFRAVYVFSTEAARTSVPLGLQGGHLLDEGDVDGQAPILEFSKEEGFVAIVEKEGKRHKLTLNFRVPIQVKEAAAGAVKRGIDLGLPGAPVTIVHLELPGQVKELRWNETLEKAKTPGRWLLSLEEKSPKLSLAWKEPVTIAGNPPLATAEGHIKVDVDEKDVHISAELILQDSRLQTKDWRLLVPTLASIDEKDIKAPSGLTFQLIQPDEKTPYYILRTSDATAERWQVTITMHVPRPNPPGRVAIGPFHVLDAASHQGTIAVKMKSDVSFGQRLGFIRYGKTYQKSADSEAVFRYEAPAVTAKNIKSVQVKQAPLELEWRFEKNQLETQVEHALKLRTVTDGWEIDATTKIQVSALFSAFSGIDLKLPPPRPRGIGAIGSAAPGLGFPGNAPWAGILHSLNMVPWVQTSSDEYDVTEESGIGLRVSPPDGSGKVRVTLERGLAPKKVVLILKNKTRIPMPHQRVRLELPRPLFAQERGVKVSIKSDERTELLFGPAGAEEPVPEHDHFDLTFDQSPAFVDVAWRPFQRDIVAQSTIDIILHEHTAQVKQTLLCPRDPADVKSSQVALRLPPGIGAVRRLPGGEIINPDAARPIAWLLDGAGKEITLQYDLPLTEKRLLEVLSVWPAHVSQKDVKVRVWSAGGIKARLADNLVNAGVWKERSIEKVAGADQFPELVLQGFGEALPLTLKVEASASVTPAAFLAERALIQVQMLDNDSQHCRARYWIRRIHAPHLDIELPLPFARFRDPPTVSIGGTRINFEKLDADERVLRVKLPPGQIMVPTVLEINFTIPADVLETTSFWRTTLYAPRFHSDVVIKQMRWQWSAAAPTIAVSLGRNVRSDVQWGFLNWLPTPEPSVSGAELDSWLTGKESIGPQAPASYSFWHVSTRPETIYHLPRQGWLIGCSGIFLILTMAGYFSRLPRLAYWLLLLILAGALLALTLLCPAVMPPLLFGLQPGFVLLVVFMGIHWFLQERYRRQLVFLPGFSRAKPGSTMVRTTAAKRPREASTVDAPEAKNEDATSNG